MEPQTFETVTEARQSKPLQVAEVYATANGYLVVPRGAQMVGPDTRVVVGDSAAAIGKQVLDCFGKTDADPLPTRMRNS